jgi:putative FmdB family regulatory protein
VKTWLTAGYQEGGVPMPTYEYRCADCNKKFSTFLTISEHEKKKVTCPKCKSTRVIQQFSNFFAVTSSKS